MSMLRQVACSSCSAPIEVASSSVTVRCSYCGSTQAVDQSIPIARHVAKIDHSVGNVDRSTARLAAEMALPRLQTERGYAAEAFARVELKVKQREAQASFIAYGSVFLVAIGVTLVAGMVASIFRQPEPTVALIGFAGFVVTAIVGPVVVMVARRNATPDTSPFAHEVETARAHLQDLDRRIEEAYRTANS